MSETQSDLSGRTPWVPAAGLSQPYNTGLFETVLPRLNLVELVEDLEIPQIIPRQVGTGGLGKIETKHVRQLERRLSWQKTPVHAALSPEIIDLAPEELPEEALVRLLLPRIFLITAYQLALPRSADNVQIFHDGCDDMELLLTSPPRPFYKYSQVRVGNRPMTSGIGYLASNRYKLEKGEVKAAQVRLGQAAIKGVVDPPDSVRRLAGAATISAETDTQATFPTLADMEPDSGTVTEINRPSANQDLVETEPILSESPWMQGFLSEFNYSVKPHRNEDEAIGLLHSGDINMLPGCSLETRELISRHGIAAYLELLAADASANPQSTDLTKTLSFVTREKDGLTNRILQIANLLSQKLHGLNSPEAKLNTLGLHWENLPQAFSMIRSALTEPAPDAVVESPKTAMFGDVVEAFLNPPKLEHNKSKKPRKNSKADQVL